jgi:hypothetical protein
MSSLVMPHAQHVPVEKQRNIFFIGCDIKYEATVSPICVVQSLPYKIRFYTCLLAGSCEEMLGPSEDTTYKGA